MRALPQVGDQIAGYRIERQLGRGGMGVVYLAEQIRLRRYVALKLITPELAEDDEFRQRFERESQLAASIEHPNVISVYEAGEADGALFISMRYVEGSDLRAIIRGQGALAPVRAATLVAQVADALDAAHARGLVHRDVKPANVLVTGAPGSEHAYLTDFGLTKHVSSSSGLTHTGQWVGTLDYVAPEQIAGGALDARVDVYALGCALFETLTGQVPYPKESDVAKMYAHMNEPPVPVSTLAQGASPAFDAVIERALAKAPEGRYPSAGDLGRAAIAAGSDQLSPVPERSVAAGSAAPTATGWTTPRTNVTQRLPVESLPPPVTQPSERPQSRPTALIVVLVALVAVAGAVAALAAAGVFSGGSDPAPAQTVIVRESATTTSPEPRAETVTEPESTGGSATYRATGYSAEYPSDWTITADDEDKGAYTETKFESPDGGATVVIDRTPGTNVDPREAAEGVRRDTSKTEGYREVTFESRTLAGGPGFEWVFELPSGHRVDFFRNAGADTFAVLGHGSDYSTAYDVALSVAESIEGR